MARAHEDADLLEAMRTIMRISLQAADAMDGSSVVQLRALTVLQRVGHANLAELADGMGITVSTTSRLVDRLVAAGLVHRSLAAHTRREIDLRLSPRGRRLLERYDSKRLTALHTCLDELTDDEREVAVQGLCALGAAARA